MLMSLIAYEQQRDPKLFLTLNSLIQFDWEMIKCTIFVEFLRIGRMLFAMTLHPHIFFSTTQNYLKKLHINIMIICTHGKKSEFFEHFWAFQSQHCHFSLCTKYCLIEHLSSILSTVAFLKNSTILLIFFNKQDT